MPAVIIVALAEWAPTDYLQYDVSADAHAKLARQYIYNEHEFHFMLRKNPQTGHPELAREFYESSNHSQHKLDEFARHTALRLLVSSSRRRPQSPQSPQSPSSGKSRRCSLGRMIRIPNTYFYIFINNSTTNRSIVGLETTNRISLTLHQLTAIMKQQRSDTFEKIARLRGWLKASATHRNADIFMRMVFGRMRAARRICAHNPAESGQSEHKHSFTYAACLQSPSSLPAVSFTPTGIASAQSLPLRYSSSEEEHDSTDLNESVKRANEARVKLISLDKCDVFVINPMFGSRLRYDCPVNYWVESRSIAVETRSHLSSFSSSSSSPQEISPLTALLQDDGAARWIREYPVHHAAYTNQAERLKELIQQGHDVNRADMDSWTPLHYAAFKDHKEAAGVLINLASADINIRTQRGVTPFHFAAQLGNALLVELLLSAPSLEIDIKDADGRTALDLCASVPKADHQATAKLIRESKMARLPKVQIDLMDGSNVMVPWVQSSKTTAADLMHQVARSLSIDQPQAQLFALWLTSLSHEVQLRPDMIVQNHMQKWPKQLQKYNPTNSDTWTEKPRLVFRRNVYTSVSKEQSLIDISTDGALQLLYHEAMHNYLRGYYPCSEQDAITLSGLILRLVAKTSLSDSRSFISDNAALQRIIPDHRLVGGAQQRQLLDRLFKEYNKLCRAAPNVAHEAGLRHKFMQLCWRFKTYGATFYTDCYLTMTQPMSEPCQATIGVNDCGIHLINAHNMVFLKSYLMPLSIHSSPTDRMSMQVIANKEQFTILSSKAELIQLLIKKHTEQLEVQLGQKRTSSRSDSASAKASTSSLRRFL